MILHEKVLRAVRRLCAERGTWTFTVGEVLRALPNLNELSVRALIASQCCVDSPQYFLTDRGYFRRVRRGVYELLPEYREKTSPTRTSKVRKKPSPSFFEVPEGLGIRDSIHVTVTLGERGYSTECLEGAVVTQGATLDDLVRNLRETLTAHLVGKERESLGLSPRARLLFTFELPMETERRRTDD